MHNKVSHGNWQLGILEDNPYLIALSDNSGILCNTFMDVVESASDCYDRYMSPRLYHDIVRKPRIKFGDTFPNEDCVLLKGQLCSAIWSLVRDSL